MNLYTEHINDKPQSLAREKLLEYFHVLLWDDINGGVFNQIRRRIIIVPGVIVDTVRFKIWG